MPTGGTMKYANFCDAGRTSVNIGDYLQFIVNDYLLRLMNVPEEEIVYLGFKELENYDGEEVVFPFCYSIIDFVKDGRIAISSKIIPVFLAVTLSTVDRFMDVDKFLGDAYNWEYLIKYGPIGCRDEVTYEMFQRNHIPAYINGCMTAAFPKDTACVGKKVLFVDAPRTLLPYLPKLSAEECAYSTQQYYFKEEEIADYKSIFAFVKEKYREYIRTAKLVVTSRLHVALPLAAVGIPVVLAKDNVDGRFSFIEEYIPVYGKEDYDKINWNPDIATWESTKELLLAHALGRVQNNVNKSELERMEQKLTELFQLRKEKTEYKISHAITHKNGERFDEYAMKYWEKEEPIQYAFWGVSENNLEYWKDYIERRYPNATLVAVYDSFRKGTLFGLPYQHPDEIEEQKKIRIIVCSVGAAQAAIKLFHKLGISEEWYCIASDCFICKEDLEGR